MTFILPSFGASAISAVPGGGGGGGGSFSNTYSVDFDGTDDFVNLGSSSDFDSVSAFTISAWIKADSFSGYPMILAKTYSTTGKAFQFYIDESTSKPTLAVNFSGFSSSTNAISTGVWTHVAVTWTSGTGAVAFYINGSASGTATGSTSITTNTDDCCIGAKPAGGGFSNYFNGLIDEVSFFNSALSASDVTSIYNSGVPADLSSYSPVGWWRMGDNDGGTGTTITDQGSGSNDGTLTNGPTYSTDVPVAPLSNSYALEFDGLDDYVTMGAPSSLDITGDMTLSIWVNTDQNTQYTGLFSKRNGSGRQFYFYLRNDSGNKNLSLQTEPSGGSLSSMNTSSNPVTLNTWHHVATVINSGVTNGTTIYVDGNAVATGTMTLASNSTAPLIIGSSTGTGNFFEGKLDEAAIFNSALSTSDVATLYNSGVPGDISSLSPVGWWRMGDNDSGTGTTITDQGSGGNDGTLTNGPTFSTTVPS
jgi:hypothetical protein